MTLRVGVIGTGAIGRDHIHRITRTLSGARIVAVADVDSAIARAVAEAEGLDAQVCATGEELIASADVDAVLVASSGHSHARFVLASIAAGKPVFCEKPLAATAADCRRIVDAEVAGGRKLVQVGFMRRYDRGYRALKQTLTDGAIGEPLMVHCAHRNASVPDFFGGDMPLTDSFVHEIDVLRWLLDDDYVCAQVILPRRNSRARADLQDPHVILLQTKRGVLIDAEVFLWCQYGYDIQCEVVGEAGSARLPEPLGVWVRSEARLSAAILTDWKFRFIEAYDIELQDWIGATQGGAVRGPTAWDGYAASVTADACVKAKHARQVVAVDMPERPVFYAPA